MRHNEDQRVQPPLMNNFSDDEQQDEERGDNEIHLITHQSQPTHLTLGEYEYQLMLNQVFEEELEIVSQHDSYQVFQAETLRRYNLSPRLAGQKQENNQNKIKKPSKNQVVPD